MFVLPMRPQPPRFLKVNDFCATSSASVQTSPTSHPDSRRPSESADAMISMMPSTRPDMPSRPKLSLKTCMPSLAGEEIAKSAINLCAMAETPIHTGISYDAMDNISSCPPEFISQTQESSTPSFAEARPSLPSSASSASSTSSSTSSLSSGQTSPFSTSAPYSLPLGSRSILRNSPLPRPYPSATSARASRRMFPPVKRVLFRELLEDIIPRQAVEALSEASDSDNTAKRRRNPSINDNIRGRRTTDEEDKVLTPIQGRRKRRREWIWRPLEDDILVSQDIEKNPIIHDAPIEAIKGDTESTHAGNPEPPSSGSLSETTEITTPRRGSESILRNNPTTADQLYPFALHETNRSLEITTPAASIRDQSLETRTKPNEIQP